MKSRIAVATLLCAAVAHAQPGAEQTSPPPTLDPGQGPEADKGLAVKLEEIIAIAVRTAPDLARARVDRTAAIHTATAARHSQSWTLTSSASYSSNGVSDQTQVAPYSQVGQDTLSIGIGLMRNLPTGGSISINTGVQSQHTEYDVPGNIAGSGSSSGAVAISALSLQESEDAFNVSTQAGFTYKQPLGRGFGGVATADIKKAEINASEATLKAQMAAEDMLKDLVTSYWELAYSSYEVDIRYQSLELARKQEGVTHEQIRGGLASPSALSQVEYEIDNRQEAALRSQLDLEQKSMEMRMKAGLEISRRDVVMRPSEPLEIGKDEPEFDAEEVIAKSRIANRKLATVALEGKLSDVDIEVARDAAKPQIDLSVSGALIGTADNAGDSVANVAGGGGYQVSIGLNMSFELSGAARRNKDAALAKRRRLDVDRADVERQIEVQTALAVRQVAAARYRVELEDRAIAVAEDNVRNERAQFMAGKTTNYNVLQRQGELIDAHLKRGRAVADYHIAVAQLEYLSGSLLGDYGVDVIPHDG